MRGSARAHTRTPREELHTNQTLPMKAHTLRFIIDPAFHNHLASEEKKRNAGVNLLCFFQVILGAHVLAIAKIPLEARERIRCGERVLARLPAVMNGLECGSGWWKGGRASFLAARLRTDTRVR